MAAMKDLIVLDLASVGPADVQGMDAQRIDHLVPVGQHLHHIEIAGLDCGKDDLCHPCGARPSHHGKNVSAKLGGIQVTVGVDPAHASMMHRRASSRRAMHTAMARDTVRLCRQISSATSGVQG